MPRISGILLLEMRSCLVFSAMSSTASFWYSLRAAWLPYWVLHKKFSDRQTNSKQNHIVRRYQRVNNEREESDDNDGRYRSLDEVTEEEEIWCQTEEEVVEEAEDASNSVIL